MSNPAINWCAELTAVKGSTRAVLYVLANRARANNKSWPSRERIVSESGFEERTVRSALKQLVEFGLIESVERAYGEPTTWLLRLDVTDANLANPAKSSTANLANPAANLADSATDLANPATPIRKNPEEPRGSQSDDEPQRGNGQPPHSPDRQLPVNSPLQPLPPAGNKQWETLLPWHELNIPANRPEYTAICSALRHRGALAEFRKARKKLLASKSRDGKVWWSEQVDLAQRIGAEWEERAAATRPDPRAELLAYEQEKIDRRRAEAARGGDA